MLTDTQKIKCMLDFTKTYAENSDNIYAREARCLDVQFSFLMLPVRRICSQDAKQNFRSVSGHKTHTEQSDITVIPRLFWR